MFHFLNVTLAIDKADEWSDKVHHELLLKKNTFMNSNQLCFTNKMLRFSFKSGLAVQVVKLTKGLAYSVTVRILLFTKILVC